MNSNASPSPDGFGLAFFKKFWDPSKLHLLSYLSDFHSRQADLTSINKSYLVLIPKKTGACSPSDFHPTSLQNTSTKVASKSHCLSPTWFTLIRLGSSKVAASSRTLFMQPT
jgi:hypothetical protein